MIFGSFLLHFASFSPVPCIQLAQARFGACLRSKVTSHRHTPSIWCGVDVELHWFPCVWYVWRILGGLHPFINFLHLFFQKIEAHLQLHCRPRSCFPNAFPDEKNFSAVFCGGCVGGLGWTNMNFGPQGQEHQTHSKLPSLLHPVLLTSLHKRSYVRKICLWYFKCAIQFDQTFANTLSKRRFDWSCEGSSKGKYGQKEISIHILYSFHFSLTSAILVSHHVTTLDSCPLPSAAASKLKPKDQLSLRMWCKSLRCLPGEYNGKVKVEIAT